MAVPPEKGQFFCEMCGHPIEREDMAGRCVVCGKVLCNRCGVMCATCGKILCRIHAREKKGAFYCEEHKPGCFIVTTVYGTSDMEHLPLFYNFRDFFLNSTKLGRIVIKIYYKVSPNIAKFIKKNEKVRRIVRELIVDPIYHILKLFV